MTLITPTFQQKALNGGAPLMPAPVWPPVIDLKESEVPQEAKQPLKVALIGTAPSSRMLSPFNDPSWKIWACSPGNMGIMPRVDAWFEIHGNLHWPECKSYGE